MVSSTVRGEGFVIVERCGNAYDVFEGISRLWGLCWRRGGRRRRRRRRRRYLVDGYRSSIVCEVDARF